MKQTATITTYAIQHTCVPFGVKVETDGVLRKDD